MPSIQFLSCACVSILLAVVWLRSTSETCWNYLQLLISVQCISSIEQWFLVNCVKHGQPNWPLLSNIVQALHVGKPCPLNQPPSPYITNTKQLSVFFYDAAYTRRWLPSWFSLHTCNSIDSVRIYYHQGFIQDFEIGGGKTAKVGIDTGSVL